MKYKVVVAAAAATGIAAVRYDVGGCALIQVVENGNGNQDDTAHKIAKRSYMEKSKFTNVW